MSSPAWRIARTAGFFGACVLGVAACGSSLPSPRTGPVPADAATVQVPYPPPAARVETIPPQKSTKEVWVDGQWDWDGKAWKWLAGSWMTPPPNAYFTPWKLELRNDGRLYFVSATWRSQNGTPLDSGYGHEVCPGAPVSNQTAIR